MPIIKEQASKSPWTFSTKNNSLFAYYKFELMPTYKFTRTAFGCPYKGHGQVIRSQKGVEEWVKAQPKPKSQD